MEDVLVTVKLTKVTREQMSGGNSTVGSLVERKMVKLGLRSMSWSPRVIFIFNISHPNKLYIFVTLIA